MTLKISSFDAEGLVLTPEQPVPVPLLLSGGLPLAPMLFPAEWSGDVTVTTRWRTDITSPSNRNKTERWALASRPIREIQVRLLGLDKGVAHAIQQAGIQHTSLRGNPVPLYCDAVTPSGSSGQTISGDFSLRRFFRGGRVVVLPGRHLQKKGSEYFFLTIKEVNSTGIEVEEVIPRAVLSSDFVIPCIDSDYSDSIESETPAMHISDVSMVWRELDGESCLPACWPACNVEDASVLSAFCKIADNKPVFPFDLDWASSCTVNAVRDFDSDESGRGSADTPMGKSYHKFSLPIQGHNRQSSWNVLRFFDSMQGRRGGFWLVHPNMPWSPFGAPVVAVDHCRIEPFGDAQVIQDHFRSVALFRENGDIVIRRVASVSAFSNHFAIAFEVDLEDIDFVDVQPIFECHFESDSLEEVWSTDSIVPRFDLSIVEDREAGPASVNVEPSIMIAPMFPKLLGVEGCNLLVSASCGCVTLKGEDAIGWPGHFLVEKWKDISQGPSRQPTGYVVEKSFTSTGNKKSAIIRNHNTWENNRQPTMMEPLLNADWMLSSATPIEQRMLWSAAGWTVFFCITPLYFAPAVASNMFLMQVAEPTGSYLFALYYDSTGLGFANRAGVAYTRADGTAGTFPFSISCFPGQPANSTIIAVRFDAVEGKARAWVNGQQATSVAQAVTGGLYVSSANYSTARVFNGFQSPSNPNPGTAYIGSIFGFKPCANMVLSYNRPLTAEEMNTVFSSIAEIYRSDVSEVSIYA